MALISTLAKHSWPRRRHGRRLASHFKPHALLRDPHLQTLLPLLRPLPPLAVRHERLELDDGDFVDLGWAGEQHRGAPLAVLVHGVAGSLQSRYLRGMAQRLVSQGWRALLLQLRGAGIEPNRLPRCYHHGDTDDLRHVCALLRQREPQTPLVAIGWSLGAGIVLKALGEDGARSPLDAAAVVSAPFDLRRCAEHLRDSARLYQQMMMRELKALARRKHPLLPPGHAGCFERAQAATDFFGFGDAWTAPLNGFADALDYCEKASCRPWLGAIARPTLVLQSMDDPILGAAPLPPEEGLAPPVYLEVSQSGGHAGFIGAGRWGGPVSWLERRLSHFLCCAVAA